MTTSLVPQNKINLLKQISKLFDKKIIEQLAHETKFIQRQSKLTGVDFFLLCVFAHQQNHQVSLEGLRGELLKKDKGVSKQSIQERFNDNAVVFMESMVNRVLAKKLNVQAYTKHDVFQRIIIRDSTVFQLPEQFADKYRGSGGAASQAAVKLQYSYDLLTQNIIAIQVQEGICPDNKQELMDVKKTIYTSKTSATSSYNVLNK